MTSAERIGAAVPSWDIAVPARPCRLVGVRMAGFSDRTAGLLDVALVPHPAVTVLFDLSDDPLVISDSSGQRVRQRIVAGLAPSGARGLGSQGKGFACLQVRLSPVVAHAVLGASSQLGGALVALDDLWGRDAERIQDQLRAAASWEDRFAIVEAALAPRYDAGPAVDPEIAFAWRRLVASQGRGRVERLAAGQSPVAVAADSGYVDQSHLHRDVVAFTGVTPAAVAKAPFLAVDDVAWAAPKR